jgi:hypothetical protein
MTTTEALVNLRREFFTDKERWLVRDGSLAASIFRFESGVCGVRLENESSHVVMLPFQGQQIWSAEFRNRNVTMRSMFSDPRRTDVYLETYGGFLVHCGATAMGVPSPKDTHPLHGELPNAAYQSAHVVVGQDERGPFIGLGGEFQYTVAFSHHYVAVPLVKLHAGSSLVWLTMAIHNLKNTEMELMYLAHVNFRPVDHGQLIYSAPCDPQHVRVRRSVPSHIHPQAGYVDFLDELARDPKKHNVLAPDLIFDPEVVFFIDYLADEDGWSHSMQVHPDGSADYVRHRPDQLDKAVRWLSRTADQDALGLVLPATAEPEGYLAERAKGNIKILPPKATFTFDMEMGVLAPPDAASVAGKISRILVR